MLNTKKQKRNRRKCLDNFAPTQQRSDSHINRPKVLCVDDDPDIAHAIALSLSSFHINLLCHFDGQQGIWFACCEKPDLIITDWMMPNANGEELVSTLKTKSRDS